MKRLLRFILWFLAGVIGTLMIPGILFSVAYLTPGTRIGHYSATLCGFSFYSIVPLGFVVSLFFALSSLRWSLDKKEVPNHSTEPLSPSLGGSS